MQFPPKKKVAEADNLKEDKAKTRKQIQDNEALKEKIRASKSDKSIITRTMRALFGNK